MSKEQKDKLRSAVDAELQAAKPGSELQPEHSADPGFADAMSALTRGKKASAAASVAASA